MGNFASTTLVSSAVAFDHSDMELDLLEKQVSANDNWWTRSKQWVLETIEFCTGGLLLSEEKESPMESTCDAATMVTPSDLWQFCEINKANTVDDDCESCATEATESLSESEGKCFAFADDDDDEFFDSMADDIDIDSDEEEELATWSENTLIQDLIDDDECDCVEMAERMILTARLSSSFSSCEHANLYLEDYLCSCDECRHHAQIVRDVEGSGLWHNEQQKRSITRLLQAFATYNEVVGYHPDMIGAARECLALWTGDEDQAFKSFVMLFDEVPYLCGSAAA